MGRKQVVGAIAGVVLTLALVGLQPFAGLSFAATVVLAVLLGAIVWWVADVLPDFVVALVMAALFVVWAGVPTDVVFGAFASSMWWLLVAAFCLGHGMRRSGLLRRMSLAVLRIFPRTFRAQAAGLMAAGMLVGPFVPSLSAKAALLTPIALTVSDEMGYERKGRQANGLFLATFTGVRTVAPAVLSASFLGYVVLGLLPQDVQPQFDMLHWLLAALPWLVVVTVLNYLAIVALYQPKAERDAAPAMPNETSAVPDAAPAATSDLGPMSFGEKSMLVIMAVTACLWFLERWHGIPAFAVALLAVAAMVACGQFKREDLRTGVAWDIVLFVGLVLGLSPVFSYVGADLWLAELCAPVLVTFAGNPYAIVTGVAVITVALRFIVVSETAFINLFMAIAVPLCATLGVSPWIIGFSVYAMVNPWFVRYQNPVYLAAIGSVNDQMTTHSEMARYCAIYACTCLIGLLISVPYWQWMGLA